MATKAESDAPAALDITCTAFCVLHDDGEWAPLKLKIVDGRVMDFTLIGLDVQPYPAHAYQMLSAAVLTELPTHIDEMMAARKCTHPPVTGKDVTFKQRSDQRCDICGCVRIGQTWHKLEAPRA